eukprot:scaffold43319_cov72-Phaeocystis_antarctica.AAC.3
MSISILGAAVPGLHATGTTAPRVHMCPDGHGRHAFSFVIPGSGLYRPAVHGRGKALPSMQ